MKKIIAIFTLMMFSVCFAAATNWNSEAALKRVNTIGTKILNEKGINITAPISADALFARIGKEYLNNQPLSYDAILACYHDQGLCPVKALAFDKAINTTIGLDIIRTSPSSGTAYDIAGKNIANPDSMVEAIKLALILSK